MSHGQNSDMPYGRRQAKLSERYMRMSVEDVLKDLDVPSLEQGLDTETVQARQQEHGKNELEASEPDPYGFDGCSSSKSR